ncbi:MAG: YdcF family protein, partial [Bacilli bacterium]|nr:YdcF family protein [Bacilli bacterium]
MGLKKLVRLILVMMIIFLSAFLVINIEVINVTRDKIITIDEIDEDNDYDCILVLGAGVRNGEPSKMLKERLDTGIEIYNEGLISTFIMSGDHGQVNYDEVNVMKNYALDNDIPSSAVFMDHAGFSTYDSLYRAKYVFGVKKVLIVTEKYHLYRALFIADRLGIEAKGVDATKEIYYGQTGREIREFLARNKDFFKTLIKPKAKYVGSGISLDQDGDVTNDNHIIISTYNG